MALHTTRDENRYQQAQIDPTFRAQCVKDAEEMARERRRVAEASGYVYRTNR
jgi:hypothetical protein